MVGVAICQEPLRGDQMTVTADVKAGYSETLDAVMKIGARDYSGRCGANLEDGTPHGGTPIRKISDAGDRI